MANYPPFSEPEKPHAKKLITPLGAAVVEALPDRKAVNRIKKRFKQMGECPISAIFTAEQVVNFYQQEGLVVKPTTPTPPKEPINDPCPCIVKGSPQCGNWCWHFGDKRRCTFCDNSGVITWFEAGESK